MATKSDFAHKLLLDLRHRKEQMAGSQYTGNSHTTSRVNAPKFTRVKSIMTINQNGKQPNLVSHKRSSSCTDFAAHQSMNLELKNQSKGRLSNVIAKLMGLDELPKIAMAFSREPTSKRKEGAVLKKIANSVNPTNADSKNVKPTQETKDQIKDGKAVDIEHKTVDRILLNNQEKPRDIVEVAEEKNQANRKEQHLSKQKLQVNKHKGRKAEPTVSTKARNKALGLLEKQFPVNQTSHGKTNITKSTTGKDGSSIMPMNQNALPKKLASRTREGVGTHTLGQKKPVKVPSVEKKENYFQIHRKGTALGKQSAMFKPKKQSSHDMAKHTGTEGKLSQQKSEEANQNITKIHKSEVSSNPLSSAQELHVETKESKENDCQKLEAPISNENESLTEPEKRLKELLVTSQLFLNTIDTLFKLNIPITILQTNDLISKNSEFKLKVHCSYEIAKRKARRQKLLNHPYAKISIGGIKVRSLDDLIKQLCKGFDVLSCYGSNRHSTAADYLHTVLEKDIQNRHPDLNSTWDFGWDTMMSTPQEKDEIVRDVEMNLLNGLLDEITLDLLQITASV